ncbi:CHAT domain-containing protein [Dendronalium sp. ChiSLP03b]|uniref:CHAT domain-containing protein n=1 Tax=Dendronalium sp. ChiSLP03b TaxID=3075381 RepID=UPI002AD2CB07|nr:CHAT domain-containing protein [Dendronalium sp. ChiSLP03b]MDZ8207984.1 CHAT domain-containing protein [Dendronalium sp. ChiSLP03b]
MKRKRFLFFRRVRYLLKYLSREAYRCGILILLAMFLAIGVLPPTFAFVAAQNSIVQGVPNAQELFQQGRNLYEAERFNEASLVFQQASVAFKAQGDKLWQAMSLSNVSLAYQQLGQWSKASQAIAQSLNLLQDISTDQDSRSQILAQALDIQGRLQLAQGKAELALNTWQQAAAIYAKIEDKTGLIRSKINSAQAWQTLGNYRQAQKTLIEINQNLQNQPDSTLKATGLRSLGNVLRVVGDLEQSRKILQQSLEVATRMRSPQVINETWLSLGNTATAQQDTPAALNYYQQAAATSTSSTTRIQADLNQLRLLLDDNQLTAAQALVSKIQAQIPNLPASRKAVYARINFAQSLMKLRAKGVKHEVKEIAQLLAIAVQQARDLQDQRAEAYALGNLGGLYEQTQQFDSAQDLTQQALVVSQAINVPDITYRWQWQLGRLLKAKGDIKGAIAAYSESVKILQSLRNDLVAINPEVQFSFRDEVEPIYRQLVNLLLRSQGNSQLSQDNLVQARAVIESLQIAELDNFFRVACLEGRPIQVDSVIDRQDRTAAVIYPIILADKLEVILKLPQQPLRHYKTSITASEVEKILDQLRQELIKPYTLQQTQALSKQVYNWLLQPAEKYLAKSQIKTLVFVLDGSLRNIPMAALYDGQHYLIEKYAIALTPGLQLLTPKSLSQQQIKVLTAGITEARQGFSALSNVALELNEIKSEVPTTVLLNQKFTSKTLQTEINSVLFPVVHLATHGQFSSKANETFILTWDGRIDVNQLDTLLRIRDTQRPNAIELLVLSACQTAAGDKRAALGLAGIAVRAGARSTLASLWNLDDASTAELMSQFYRELISKQLTKAEALRQAQLALLKNPKYQHPIFWAPYVLLGNWL